METKADGQGSQADRRRDQALDMALEMSPRAVIKSEQNREKAEWIRFEHSRMAWLFGNVQSRVEWFSKHEGLPHFRLAFVAAILILAAAYWPMPLRVFVAVEALLIGFFVLLCFSAIKMRADARLAAVQHMLNLEMKYIGLGRNPYVLTMPDENKASEAIELQDYGKLYEYWRADRGNKKSPTATE